MSRIDEMLAEHGSGGVSFHELSAISTTVSGLSGKSKADFSNGNAPYVSYKNAFANLKQLYGYSATATPMKRPCVKRNGQY